ncbi:MAG: response regulator transcription factor [Betaproteobacteria bacterium]|nr:response regulator transcription factor [Betaproteobacteria bacterium]
MIRVLLVEDEPGFAERFADIVRSDPEFELIGIAPNCAAARAVLAVEKPDILLADLGLPDGSGIDIIRETAARYPDCDIMVVSVFGDEDHVLASIEAGAAGYVLKDSIPEEFLGLLRQLRAGGSPITPVIARKLLTRFKADSARGAEAKAPAADAPPGVLSPRETEVLTYIAKGFSFNEIAELLGMSAHTVTTHVKRIYQKLAVHSRGEAVYEATQMGLLRQ